MRSFSFSDHCIALIDDALRTILPKSTTAQTRANPSDNVSDNFLSPTEKKHAAGLMRVNHSGEVAAQALYQGQAIYAREETIRNHLQQAAVEEIDHLSWCEQRLSELGSSPSLLNPIWHYTSLILGIVAGLAGDAISLGFLAETEEQVTRHLHKHLQLLPKNDLKSRAIVKQMAIDENNHALAAYAHGGRVLPSMIRLMMKWGSKVLTKSSYYI